MERLVILKKLQNENVIKKITSSHIWLKIPKGVNSRWIFEMAKELRQFMKVTITLFFIIGFTIINISDNKVWIAMSSDLTTGTDTACEEYWYYIDVLLTMFKEVNIVNRGWVPSDKVITESITQE